MIKLFTPSKIAFSSLLAEVWEKVYRKQMIRKLGVELPSFFFYNDGTGFHLLRKTKIGVE